jgi:TPR repeat protein
MHEDGRGTSKDDNVAAKYYDTVGYFIAAAGCRLGSMFQSGRRFEQSHPRATWWYRKAAKLGSAEATARLSGM